MSSIFKFCNKCKFTKLKKDFYTHINAKDKLSTICIKCEKENKNRYYINHKVRCLERNKLWRETNKERKKETNMKYNLKNKAMISKKHKKWYRDNQSKLKVQGRIQYLQRKYNLTLESKHLILQTQNYLCPICKRKLASEGHTTHVDHDHNTGKVRGILCRQCNNALGLFQEDINVIQQAIEYLNKHK